MKLMREGMYNRQGWACLFSSGKPKVAWNEEGSGVTLTVTGVISEDERSTYKYRVVLEREDLEKVLLFLCERPTSVK